MRSLKIFGLLAVMLTYNACIDELLHPDLSVDSVPETVEGAQPLYQRGRLADASIIGIPDTIRLGLISIDEYAVAIVPFKGIALWRTPPNRSSIPVGFVNLPGLLDYTIDRNRSSIIVSRAFTHYRVSLSANNPQISQLSSVPSNFDPYRFLEETLDKVSPNDEDQLYFNCPDPDSVLIGFNIELLNSPSCRYK